MARTAYNDPTAESIYQYGAGNTKRMPDAISNAQYPATMNKSPSGGASSSGHDQKITKKDGYKGK